MKSKKFFSNTQRSSYGGAFSTIFMIVRKSINYLAKNPVAVLYFVAQLQVILAQASVPKKGLVAEFLFDNGNALDTSGNENHGTVFGAQPAIDRWGNANSAMEFDGKSFIQGYADGFPHNDKPVSVSVWLKAYLTAIGSEKDKDSGKAIYDRGGAIYGHGGGNPKNPTASSLIMNLNNWCLPAETYSVQSHNNYHEITYTDSEMKDTASEWVHLVFTNHKHHGMQLYINGKWKKGAGDPMVETYVEDKLFFIGGIPHPTGTALYTGDCVTLWFGLLDNLRIYNYELTQDDVTDLFNEKPESDLTPLWISLGCLLSLASGMVGTHYYKNWRQAKADEAKEKTFTTSSINDALTVEEEKGSLVQGPRQLLIAAGPEQAAAGTEREALIPRVSKSSEQGKPSEGNGNKEIFNRFRRSVMFAPRKQEAQADPVPEMHYGSCPT